MVNEDVSRRWLDFRGTVSSLLDRYLVQLRENGNLVGTLNTSGPGGPYVEFINQVADHFTPRLRPRKIAVVGSRSWSDHERVAAWFNMHWRPNTQLVSGGANGADLIAAANAIKWAGPAPIIITPNYTKWPAEKFGKDMAPKMRNQDIVDKADLVVAFWDQRSTGTAYTIAYAVRQGKPVEVVVA